MKADVLIDRAVLRAALSLPASVASKRSPLPMARLFRLEALVAELAITANDLAVQVTSRIPAEVKEERAYSGLVYSGLVDAAKLSDVIGARCEAGPVGLTIKGDAMLVTSGKRSYRLALTAGEEPALESLDLAGMSGTRFSAKQLHGLIRRVLFAADDDWTRPSQSCVRIRAARASKTKRGPLLATSLATDGRRCAVATTEVADDAETDVTLPKTTAKLLMRELAPLGDGVNAYLTTDGPCAVVFFQTTDDERSVSIRMRLGEKEQAPVEDFMKLPGASASRVRFSCPRVELMSALSAASRSDGGVVIEATDDGLRLTSDEPERGSEIVLAGNVLDQVIDQSVRPTISVSAEYIVEHLGVLEDDVASLGFRGPLDPVQILSGDRVVGLVMPRRP